METGERPRHGTSPLHGKWVLADAEMRVLSIGRNLYHGQSARPLLDFVGRQHLLPSMTQVLETGEARHFCVKVAGAPWVIHVEPVIGPSGAPHAVLACCTGPGEEPDERPQIGCWDWDVPSLRTRWSRELFRVYGFEEPPTDATGEERAAWDAPEWFALLEQGSYPQMRSVLARFHTAEPSELITHIFRISRADGAGYQTLRLAGHVTRAADGTPSRFIGTTMRVDGYVTDLHETFEQQQMLDAVLTLTRWPVLVVDLSDNQIHLTSKPLDSVGIRAAPDKRLLSMVHPDDRSRLGQAIREAPVTPASSSAVHHARFAEVGGGWRQMSMSVLRLSITSDVGTPDHVVCLLGGPED